MVEISFFVPHHIDSLTRLLQQESLTGQLPYLKVQLSPLFNGVFKTSKHFHLHNGGHKRYIQNECPLKGLAGGAGAASGGEASPLQSDNWDVVEPYLDNWI